MSSIRKLHEFVRQHDGDEAAYLWLVAHVENLANKVESHQRQIATLKSRITRLRNENRTNHSRRPRHRVEA